MQADGEDMTKRHTLRDKALMMQAFAPEGAELPEWVDSATNRRRPLGPRKHPEEDLQIECCEYLSSLPSILFFSVPNHLYKGDNADPGKHAWYMAKQKRMGFRPGVSDLVVVFRDKHGKTCVCFFELKAGANKLSDEQASFHDKANALGCYTATIRTKHDLVNALRAAGLLIPPSC